MARRGRRKARARPRFQRFRRAGRRVRRGIGKAFNLGMIAKGAGLLFIVDRLKGFVGLRLGDKDIDDDIDMIIAGFLGPRIGMDNGHMVPAGASKLIKDLADRALAGQGFGFGGGGLGGGAVGD